MQKGTRKNSVIIVGVELGDEGKGKIVDTKLQELASKKGIQKVYVVRYQGGSNAGHTVDTGKEKIALHQVPSGIFHENAICILDAGMLLHAEDLRTEISYAEKAVTGLKKRLAVSQDAMLCTDLERAEEVLNRIKDGKAKGGTGRGIAPTVAHSYDRTGFRMSDLVDINWEKRFREKYQRYEKDFQTYGESLAGTQVPDFAETKRTGVASTRTVGDEDIFIKRLEETRDWFIKHKLVQDTYLIHHDIMEDKSVAVLFEGAQGLGLHPRLGTFPDVTSTDPSIYGVREGTRYWQAESIEEKYGVFKITYTSSVGARTMPTEVAVDDDADPKTLSSDQKWALFVRKEAHEYGTTTGRPRDICYLDIPFLMYNIRMAGVESLVGTHLDIAKEDQMIKVCTHYNIGGKEGPYKPHLDYLKDVEPQYSELPGWDGDIVQKATKISDVPNNARAFLAFIEERVGTKIVAATNGPRRDQILFF